MNGLGYILTAWILTVVAIGGYSWRVLARGRALSKLVPEGRRRYMEADDRG